MAFEFKRREPVSKAFRRLFCGRIENALNDLEQCNNRLDAVHEVGKEIKRLRALLRLFRAAIKRSDRKWCAKKLRQAAAYLADARDAHVKSVALTELAKHFKQNPATQATHSFAGIQKMLDDDCCKEQARLLRAGTKPVSRILKKLAKAVSEIHLKCSGWQALAPGLKRTYGRGRRGHALARQNRTDSDFHQWRKRVKDLYYHLGLLCPMWPEQMCAAEAELDRLGELLGDDHDLALLKELAGTKRFKKRLGKEIDLLAKLCSNRQQALRRQAMALGSKFYQDKPSVFDNRLGQYWKRWRHQPKEVKAS
jgi:CHAD domain-containing protein